MVPDGVAENNFYRILILQFDHNTICHLQIYSCIEIITCVNV